jgi:glutamate synthase (NADPH) small chain
MSLTQSLIWTAKHAWCEVTRESPPKRPAIERTADFQEIYRIYDPRAVRIQASRCIQCPEPLCRKGCPLSNRIPEWLSLAAEGNFIEASEVSRSTSNMPEICSRVCPQERLCESWCILNSRSEPMAIGAVEKFINEYAFAHHAVHPLHVESCGGRVAVIGSGPGGLACADELGKLGYQVTVFESQPRLGGLLVNGIPAFKLDKRVVQRRINLLRAQGVVFRPGVSVGKDISLGELRAHFHAVFLAFGAQQPKPLDIPGGHLQGIFPALPFLTQHNAGWSPIPLASVEGKSVAVLGGGDTAMDCLRTAVRCGAREAVCLYRRDLENMPGSRSEYAHALEEGAQFRFLTNPVALEGDSRGHVAQVRCVQMELGEPDAKGRRRPRPIPRSEFTMPAEIVLVAYGFDPSPFPDDSFFSSIATEEWGGIIVDDHQMTSLPGIFAGGDAVTGPNLVVHAVRDGRLAAAAIHQYLASIG